MTLFKAKTKYLFIFLISLSAFAQNGILKGKVVGITDGDSFTLLTSDNRQFKIRLYGIDCPERHQAYGTGAKQFIAELIFGKEVAVYPKDIDHYGRTVGEVFVDDRNINREMVENGYAWWYREYSPNDKAYGQLEAKARQYQRGLWQDENPTPPWEFRNGKTTVESALTENGVEIEALPTALPQTGILIFNTRSRKYHCPTCPAVPTCTRNCIEINAADLYNYGGIPCKICGGRCR
jgi:micrococcal nuclease